MKRNALQVVAAAGVLSLCGAPAFGQTHELIRHGAWSGPMDRCQPALRADQAAFRKRPLALQNEGAGTAFVTCGFAWELLSDLGWGHVPGEFVGLHVWFTNRGGATATISCTAVFGRELDDTHYSTQSVTIGPGARGELAWSDEWDVIPVDPYRTVSVSCAVPPGVGVNESVIETLRADFT